MWQRGNRVHQVHRRTAIDQENRRPFIPATRKLSLAKMICMVFACCAAAAIPSPAQTFTTLASFTGTNGFEPLSSLTQASDGNFYGTTSLGGDLSTCSSYGCGTIFKMTPSGKLTVIYRFSGSDGIAPETLAQGSDGNFYGTTFCTTGSFHLTTSSRGAALTCYGGGTVFKVSPDGTLITLYSFSGPDGANPSAGLVQASDGNFYGTTSSGGNFSVCNFYGCGTVFKVTPSGRLTTLHSF